MEHHIEAPQEPQQSPSDELSGSVKAGEDVPQIIREGRTPAQWPGRYATLSEAQEKLNSARVLQQARAKLAAAKGGQGRGKKS
ncbi:MAG: hypothetical protein CMP81_02165 [Fulvimarina sp.]|nr:hypothetical protein [Fulvimarina sp.]